MSCLGIQILIDFGRDNGLKIRRFSHITSRFSRVIEDGYYTKYANEAQMNDGHGAVPVKSFGQDSVHCALCTVHNLNQNHSFNDKSTV